MVQELTSKISLINWALGGNLIRVSKADKSPPRLRSTKQVVVTELDSVCLMSLFASNDSSFGRYIWTRINC
jgi:hypothetical protein